ncbi:Glutamate receptor [Armadillidium vulgare]|nr:Glutamate receptor [Armadillidium vulgare]
MQAHLETSSLLYSATDMLHGSLQDDGVTWTGMIGHLYENKADISVAPFTPTVARLKAIDFTLPSREQSLRLYLRKPSLEGSWELYVLPFNLNVWLCLPFLVVALASIISKLKQLCHRRLWCHLALPDV